MHPIDLLIEFVSQFPPDTPASALAGVILRVECA